MSWFPRQKPFLLVFLSLLAACVSAPPVSIGTFAGYYSSSFESSSFVTCEMQANPNSGASYWLSAEPQTSFFDRLNSTVAQASPNATPLPYAIKSVFVTFEGKLSPPGQYGHLGQYQREITVTHLIDMTLPAEHQCP